MALLLDEAEVLAEDFEDLLVRDAFVGVSGFAQRPVAAEDAVAAGELDEGGLGVVELHDLVAVAVPGELFDEVHEAGLLELYEVDTALVGLLVDLDVVRMEGFGLIR